METCDPSGCIIDLAISLGLKTLVCSTNEDAWKWSNVKLKTDKDDALKLARMAMNQLKAVHMHSEEHREFRSLVKYRKSLDQRVNKMKCTILAWFVNHGIPIDAGETARGSLSLFNRQFLAGGWLDAKRTVVQHEAVREQIGEHPAGSELFQAVARCLGQSAVGVPGSRRQDHFVNA